MTNLLLSDVLMPTHSLSGIMVSFRMFESARTAPLGIVPMPRPDEINKREEAHCVFLTGFDSSDGSIGFVNSWGAGWGDKGYGWLSEEYLRSYMLDAWLIRNIRYGPTRFSYSSFTKAKSNSELFNLWQHENPRQQIGSFKSEGNNYKILVYETVSLIDECTVQVIEVRDGIGILNLTPKSRE